MADVYAPVKDIERNKHATVKIWNYVPPPVWVASTKTAGKVAGAGNLNFNDFFYIF